MRSAVDRDAESAGFEKREAEDLRQQGTGVLSINRTSRLDMTDLVTVAVCDLIEEPCERVKTARTLLTLTMPW